VDRVERVWRNHSMPEVIEALITWGHGTGEELYDFLVNDAEIPKENARNCMQVLNAAMENI